MVEEERDNSTHFYVKRNIEIVLLAITGKSKSTAQIILKLYLIFLSLVSIFLKTIAEPLKELKLDLVGYETVLREMSSSRVNRIKVRPR